MTGSAKFEEITNRAVGVFVNMETCHKCYREVAMWSNQIRVRCECGEWVEFDPVCSNCDGHGYELEGWPCPVCDGEGRIES